MRRVRKARAGSEPACAKAVSYHRSASLLRPARRSRSARIDGTVLDRASRGSSATSSRAASPAGKPSRNPMASARLARATGESAICEQPVVGRADRRPVGLVPARRRRVHRGDHRLRQIRARLHPRPAAAAAHRWRSCRGPIGCGPVHRAAPVRRRRRRGCRRRESCSSTRAASACASRASGISAHSSPASRTPSSHSSSRMADGPAVDQ